LFRGDQDTQDNHSYAWRTDVHIWVCLQEWKKNTWNSSFPSKFKDNLFRPNLVQSSTWLR
jgi:hypothetical protein